MGKRNIIFPDGSRSLIRSLLLPANQQGAELQGAIVALKIEMLLRDGSISKFILNQSQQAIILPDNSAAISAPQKNYSSTKHTFLSDGDIIWTLIRKLKILPFRIRLHHVKGHQDRHQTYENLSMLAKLNVQMDEYAKLFFTNPSNAPTYSITAPFFKEETVAISDTHSKIINNMKHNNTNKYIMKH